MNPPELKRSSGDDINLMLTLNNKHNRKLVAFIGSPFQVDVNYIRNVAEIIDVSSDSELTENILVQNIFQPGKSFVESFHSNEKYDYFEEIDLLYETKNASEVIKFVYKLMNETNRDMFVYNIRTKELVNLLKALGFFIVYINQN